MSFDIKLNLENKDEAIAQLKKIQIVLDDLVDANNIAKKMVEEANEVSENLAKHCDTFQKSNIDLVDALKNIHIVLNAKSDLFKDDIDMGVIMKNLATFVISSGAVKSGVLGESNS